MNKEDTKLLFEALSKIIQMQEQIVKGLISIAKKEGMAIYYGDDENKRVDFFDNLKEYKDGRNNNT